MNKEVSLKRSHKPKGVMKKNMKNEHEKKDNCSDPSNSIRF